MKSNLNCMTCMLTVLLLSCSAETPAVVEELIETGFKVVESSPVTVGAGDNAKTLHFNWGVKPAACIDRYRIETNPDGESGFSTVETFKSSGRAAYQLTIPVHLTDWANARYRMVALDADGNELIASADVDLANNVVSEDVIGYIKASDPSDGDKFGHNLALSSDGKILAVGAIGRHDGKGAVYMFTCDDSGVWSQINSFSIPGPVEKEAYLGYSLALSSNGEILAVGADREYIGPPSDSAPRETGAVYVYKRDGDGLWQLEQRITADNDDRLTNRFGAMVALSAAGHILAVGAPREGVSPASGAVHVFRRDDSCDWVRLDHLYTEEAVGDDDFGHGLAISHDGKTIAIGAHHEEETGAVHIFTRDNDGRWTQKDFIKAGNGDPGDRFGISVSLSADGNTLAVGALDEDSPAQGIGGDSSNAPSPQENFGAVYVYKRNAGGNWREEAYIKASNAGSGDVFGYTVMLSSDGNFLAVGAHGEESSATGVDGDQANDTAGKDTGAVYMFVRDDRGDWEQKAYIKAVNTGTGDQFGLRFALSGDHKTLAVGAPYEDNSAAGIGNDQEDDDDLHNSGAVYLY